MAGLLPRVSQVVHEWLRAPLHGNRTGRSRSSLPYGEKPAGYDDLSFANVKDTRKRFISLETLRRRTCLSSGSIAWSDQGGPSASETPRPELVTLNYRHA
jgi:hypothetical protein